MTAWLFIESVSHSVIHDAMNVRFWHHATSGTPNWCNIVLHNHFNKLFEVFIYKSNYYESVLQGCGGHLPEFERWVEFPPLPNWQFVRDDKKCYLTSLLQGHVAVIFQAMKSPSRVLRSIPRACMWHVAIGQHGLETDYPWPQRSRLETVEEEELLWKCLFWCFRLKFNIINR